MAFKKTTTPIAAPATPEALIRDLSGKKIKAPFSHQADVWRAYMKVAVHAPDVAIQLPTGSGKTLVGLGLGEWRRRFFKERVVYLCLTNQLVHQVAAQSRESYGIHAHAFTGSKDGYSAAACSAYSSGEALAITNYSSLFNVKPYFDDANTIICDDIHAADSYIANPWTMTVSRKDSTALFNAIRQAISKAIPVEDAERLASVTAPADARWIGKVPTPNLQKCAEDVRSVVDKNLGSGSHRYPWMFLRDFLHASHLYYTYEYFCLRPYIPPTQHHAPFRHPGQRIYMSATLGASGDLERFTGRHPIERIPAPDGWDSHGTGRRLFFFPTRALEQEPSLKVALALLRTAGRGLVLVPDGRLANAWRERLAHALPGVPLLSAQEIEESKAAFTSKEMAVAVVANRYDGIDFPEDECRLSLIEGLPDALNPQEAFLSARLAGGPLLRDRVTTRLLQGFGRCTRSPTDYAAIVVLGQRLANYLQRPDMRRHLHPELQAELEFAIQQADGLKSNEFVDLFNLMLKQGDDWEGAEEQIKALRAQMRLEPVPGATELSEAVEYEVAYQYALWEKRFVEAADLAQKAADAAKNPDLRSYRAWWLYCAGSAAAHATAAGQAKLGVRSKELLLRAAKAVPIAFPWLMTLMPEADSTTLHDRSASDMADRIGKAFLALGTPLNKKLDAAVSETRKGLYHGDAKAFERAHEFLGRLLGYESGRPAESEQAAPDVWWSVFGKTCFVFEDHSDASTTSLVSPEKARQAAGHDKWLVAKKLASVDGAQIIRVLLTPCTKSNRGTLAQLGGVSVWPRKDFFEWVEGAFAALDELRRRFDGEADLEWLAAASEIVEQRGLSPATLTARLAGFPAEKVIGE